MLFFLIDLLDLLSFDELYLFAGEYDDDGYGSGSPGMCTFSFCSGKSVGFVSGVGSGVFFLTRIESIGDVVPFFFSVPIGVKSKGGRLIELFWRPKSLFTTPPLLVSKSILEL